MWSLLLSDALREMGFLPSRADPDLWLKKSEHHKGYDYVATHVDDLIVVAKDPMIYLKPLGERFALRNSFLNPDFYLGSNWSQHINRHTKISNEKYIQEAIWSYEKDFGSIKKKAVPAKQGD